MPDYPKTSHDSSPPPRFNLLAWLLGTSVVAFALCIIGLGVMFKLTQSNPRYADGGWLWVPLILGGLAFVLFFICLGLGIALAARGRRQS
jgi:hypothetical protein